MAATHSALEVGENLRAQRAETAKPARRSGTVSTQTHGERQRARCMARQFGTAERAQEAGTEVASKRQRCMASTFIVFATMSKLSSVTRAGGGPRRSITTAARPVCTPVVHEELVDDLRMHIE